MSAIIQSDMTESCARDLTNQINSVAEDLAGMLQRAHDGKAWSALGYASWKDYVRAELKMSERRSFQLLNFAEIRDQLNNCSVVPTAEAVTRELKRVEPSKRQETYTAAVEKAGGKEPTAKQVREAAVEVLPPEPKEASVDDDPDIRSHGLRYSVLAIDQLKKIHPKDTQRAAAFAEVVTWICEGYSAEHPESATKAKPKYTFSLGLDTADMAIRRLETITEWDSQRKEGIKKTILHCLKMLKESR